MLAYNFIEFDAVGDVLFVNASQHREITSESAFTTQICHNQNNSLL